jgi:hypothetical protein
MFFGGKDSHAFEVALEGGVLPQGKASITQLIGGCYGSSFHGDFSATPPLELQDRSRGTV